MSLKRIVIFSAVHLPNIGGVERYTDRLAHELVELGYSVTIVTNDTFKIGAHDCSEKGIDIIRFPCFPFVNGRMPIPKFGGAFHELWSELDRIECDGVLINTRFYFHTLLGLAYARRHKITPVVLDHGSAYLTFGSRFLDIFERIYEHAITWCDKRFHPNFYGVSTKSVEWLQHFGINAKGILSNSIDAEDYRLGSSGRNFRKEFNVAEDYLLVVFTGRFIPEKGIDVLVGAMRLLQDEPVVLMMAGDGPLKGNVEASGLSNIITLGRLNQSDIAALLLEADVFCLPTRSEGFCTSLLEASACGTASVITDVGGARELIPDDSYGWVLNDVSAEVIANKLKSIVDDRDVVSSKGDKARKWVEEHCSWRGTALAVLEAVLERG